MQVSQWSWQANIPYHSAMHLDRSAVERKGRKPPTTHTPPPGPPPPNARQQFPRQDAAYMIFTSESDDTGSRRARQQAVNATMPAVPQRMNWSNNIIAWGPEDHPSVMPNPGSYALVMDVIVAAPLYSCKF